jgi:hypothetical protein
MDILEFVASAIAIGAGATAITDGWAIARRKLFGNPVPDWALVGRWFAHLARGRFRHAPISATPAVRGERLLGWTAHYAVGIAFAAALLAAWGVEWARDPRLGPAMVVGLASVAAPFFILQPGMGAGVAARRAKNPAAARVQSVVTHAVFGLGLYAAGWAARFAGVVT